MQFLLWKIVIQNNKVSNHTFQITLIQRTTTTSVKPLVKRKKKSTTSVEQQFSQITRNIFQF